MHGISSSVGTRVKALVVETKACLGGRPKSQLNSCLEGTGTQNLWISEMTAVNKNNLKKRLMHYLIFYVYFGPSFLGRFLWRNFHFSNLYTPSCSPGHAISKTVSWASVALFLLVVVSFERYVAKVSIVQRSQNVNFVDGNLFFLAQPQILKMHWNRQFSKYLGVPEMALLSTKVMCWDHVTIYFSHITTVTLLTFHHQKE